MSFLTWELDTKVRASARAISTPLPSLLSGPFPKHFCGDYTLSVELKIVLRFFFSPLNGYINHCMEVEEEFLQFYKPMKCRSRDSFVLVKRGRSLPRKLRSSVQPCPI